MTVLFYIFTYDTLTDPGAGQFNTWNNLGALLLTAIYLISYILTDCAFKEIVLNNFQMTDPAPGQKNKGHPTLLTVPA